MTTGRLDTRLKKFGCNIYPTRIPCQYILVLRLSISCCYPTSHTGWPQHCCCHISCRHTACPGVGMSVR